MPMSALHQEEGPRVREEAPRVDGVRGDGTKGGEKPKVKVRATLKDLPRDFWGKARARECMDESTGRD